jgi:hypothetical protein
LPDILRRGWSDFHDVLEKFLLRVQGEADLFEVSMHLFPLSFELEG